MNPLAKYYKRCPFSFTDPCWNFSQKGWWRVSCSFEFFGGKGIQNRFPELSPRKAKVKPNQALSSPDWKVLTISWTRLACRHFWAFALPVFPWNVLAQTSLTNSLWPRVNVTSMTLPPWPCVSENSTLNMSFL